MVIPPILCVVGHSGSGKTTLLEQLIEALSSRGRKVAAIKHAAHGLDVASGGKDAARLAAAGARPSIAAAADHLIVHHASPAAHLLDLAATFCAGSDVVLAEGYKRSSHDKILVLGGGDGGAAGGGSLSSVRLVAAGGPDRPAGAADRDDIAAVAAWVEQWLIRRRRLGEGVVGAILAGGDSRRMGADKADMHLGGRAVLAHLAEVLAGRVEEVWIVGRPATGDHLPRCLRWHLDLRRGCGPLGGILTAGRVAAATRRRAVLAVACDMPALTGEAVDLLLAGRQPQRAASALRDPSSRRLEPLAAVYEPAAMDAIERALEKGELSAGELLASLGASGVEVPPETADQLRSVNTPEDLARIEEGDR
jgi:molybdopterin-guanine dinucleotide biosynthesis protein B